MASFIAPIASGIGSIIGGIVGSNASGKASSQITQNDIAGINTLLAGRDSNNTVLQQGQQVVSPYTNAGTFATNQLVAGLSPGGQFTQTLTPDQILQQDPGYQFQQQQGEEAIQRGAAAQGTAISGGELKDLDTYNQNLASNAYQQAFNNFNQTQNQNYSRLLSLTGIGAQEANVSNADLEQSEANTLGINAGVAGLYENMGQGQAAGTLGSASSINNAISGVTNAIGQIAGLSSLNNSSPDQNTPTYDPTTGTEVYPGQTTTATSAPATTGGSVNPYYNPAAVAGFGVSSLTPANGAPSSAALPFGF